MADFFVTNSNDDGDGSLRDAIRAANAADGADTISFDPSLNGQTITLTSGSLGITDDLTILGADALTIDGNGADVFAVDATGKTVTITGITIKNAEDGIQISRGASDNTLTVTDSRIIQQSIDDGLSIDGTDNRVTVKNTLFAANEDNLAVEGDRNIVALINSTSAIAREDGIEIDGSDNVVTVTDTTVNNNGVNADGPNDGLDIDGARNLVRVEQSTFSGNGEDGLEAEGTGNRLIIGQSTVTGNGRDGILNQDASSTSRVILSDSIVAGNDDGPDIASDFTGGVRGEGYNLIGNGTWSTVRNPDVLDNNGRPVLVDFTSTGASGFDGPGEQVGTPSQPISAGLGPLQDNGGFGQTNGLLAGSPAIDSGDPNFVPPPVFDQRGTGFPRVQGTVVDIGAVEFAPPRVTSPLRVTVDSLFVGEAGEDRRGSERDPAAGAAEWRAAFRSLSTQQAPITLAQDGVHDGDLLAVQQSFSDLIGDTDTLSLRAGGFENDVDPPHSVENNDLLPAIQVDITPSSPGSFPLESSTTSEYDIAMKVAGRAHDSAGTFESDVNHSDFAYEVDWHVAAHGAGQPVEVTLERLHIIEAGVDGDNRLAEWNLTFIAGTTGQLEEFQSGNLNVRNSTGSVAINHVFEVASGGNDFLILRTGGFEDDLPNLPDRLPAAEITIRPFGTGFGLSTAVASGIGDQFAYETNWRVATVPS